MHRVKPISGANPAPNAGKTGKVILVAVYGHHPTEVKATIKAARAN